MHCVGSRVKSTAESRSIRAKCKQLDVRLTANGESANSGTSSFVAGLRLWPKHGAAWSCVRSSSKRSNGCSCRRCPAAVHLAGDAAVLTLMTGEAETAPHQVMQWVHVAVPKLRPMLTAPEGVQGVPCFGAVGMGISVFGLVGPSVVE